MLQNSRVAAFIISELLWENQQGIGFKITPTTPRLGLICSFYCYLVKKGLALKVAKQLSIRGLVTYKPVAYIKK